MEVGERIKRRREQLNMTQDELAQKVGYTSRSSIAKVEANANGMVQSKLVLFAQALGTTPSYLMGWTEPEEETQKKNDTITDIILRLRTDAELLSLFTDIAALAPDQIKVVQATVGAFKQQQIDHID